MKKKLLSILLTIALLTLTACSQQPAESDEHLISLYIESQGDGYFYGKDSEGKLWHVNGYDNIDWICGWVRYTGEPQPGTDADYEITATHAWHTVECDKVFYREAFDTCWYDHDDDGVEELCVLARFEDSEPGQYELTVWDGDTCEANALFHGSGSAEALAFDWEGDRMVIRSIHGLYGAESWTIDTYNVSWQKGGPVVSRALE